MKAHRLAVTAVLLTGAVLGVVRLSEAGSRVTTTLTVGTPLFGPNDALGHFGSIRNSANNVESAECRVSSRATSRSASCRFSSAAGVHKSCSTSDPNLVFALSTMKGDSAFYVAFDQAGTCVLVQVVNSSQAAPKVL